MRIRVLLPEGNFEYPLPDIDATWRRFCNRHCKGDDIWLGQYWERDWQEFYKAECESVSQRGKRRALILAKDNQTNRVRREREREAEREKAWNDDAVRRLRSKIRDDLLDPDAKALDPDIQKQLRALCGRIINGLDDGQSPSVLGDEYRREKARIMAGVDALAGLRAIRCATMNGAIR